MKRAIPLGTSSYSRLLSLLLAAALALGVLMVLLPTLPVQAQSEGTYNYTDTPQPTGKHLVVFSTTNTLPTGYEQRIADLGGTVEVSYPEIGVAVASGLSEEAAQSLESFEDVQAVDEDVERQWLAPVGEPLVVEASSAEVEPPSPNDNPTGALYYDFQWNMRAIGADKAWAKGELGSSDVTVAILDTGIEASREHFDLLERIDEERSRSFVPEDDALVDRFFRPVAPWLPYWTDLHFHGTLVASQVSSNAVMTAGVTSKVKLMAVKVLGVGGRAPRKGCCKD